MSKEKKIEERNELLNIFAPSSISIEEASELTDRIFDAGYSKRSEGEWVRVYQNDKATVYECSRCKHLTFGTSDYCLCGAKMKGVRYEH